MPAIGIRMISVLFCLGFVPGVSTEATKCGFQADADCYGNDIGGVTNKTEFMTPQACCLLCSKTASCNVSVYIPDRYGDGKMSSCLMKSSCQNKTYTKNRIKCCQQADQSCPAPPPPQPCPCTSCPCPPGPLPRTCDSGSVSSSLPFCDVAKSVATRVEDLLSRLTREEKINLVEMADTGFLPRLNLKEFNFFSTCVHGWWTTNVTTFGMPVGLAASFDTELMRRVADVIGEESRALSQRDYLTSFDPLSGYHGVSLDWLVCKDSSEVNMNRHPLWGRNPETYGEDPYLTATMGEAFTQQLQQPNASTPYKRTIAVTRHLVVYSGPESLKDDNTQGENRFKFNANVTERDLEAYFYPPFEACIDRNRGNSAGAMCSDAAQNGVPSCASELLMKQKPKDWHAADNFFVVSDMGSYYNVYRAHEYRNSTREALIADMQSGLDILYLRRGPRCRARMASPTPGCPDTAATMQQVNETHDALDSLTNGSNPDPRFTLLDLDAKASTALRLRFDLGEFDPVDGNPYAQPVSSSTIDSPPHRLVARETASSSVILVKNEDQLLPLSKSAKVAAIGPWMKPLLQPSLQHQRVNPYVHAYAGSSSVQVNFFEGLSAQLSSPPVFVQGCETNQTSPDDPNATFASAKQAATDADVTILAVGLTASVQDKQGVGLEAEMRDRLSLHLPQVQRDLIAAVSKVARKLVLVIVSGSAVPFNDTNIDAAVYALYGGEEAGNGLADVLFGRVSPSGRLPFTVFRSLSQMRPMGDYDLTTQPGRTHLYFDDEAYGLPQFWFGFGLSYSTFEYTKLTLKLSKVDGNNRHDLIGQCTLTATVTVTNTGAKGAREVAQLYLNRPPPPKGLPMAQWALRGYDRTPVLEPGASATLDFTLTFRDLSTVAVDGSRSVTGGHYTVNVGGGHPRDIKVPSKGVQSTINIKPGCAS